MRVIEQVLLYLNLMYKPADVFFSWMFFFAPGLLRTLTISVILILTLGKIFDIMKRKCYQILKWIVYIWFFGYSLYTLGIFGNLLELQSLKAIDWSTFAFTVLAPISMLVVGKQIGSLRIKGHKIFIYYVVMMLYLLIAILWYTYYPNEVNFTVLVIYWVIALVFVSIINYMKGG